MGLLGGGGDANIPLVPAATPPTIPAAEIPSLATTALTTEGDSREASARPKSASASTTFRKKSKSAATQFVFAPQQAAGATTRFGSGNILSVSSPTASVQEDPQAVSSISPSDAWLPEETGDVRDASTTPPDELKQWKVIGIAVITITFIAIVVLAVTFFDSWWTFLRAAICGKRRGGKKKEFVYPFGGEMMVPDWDKRSWEFKLASEDGHRYPTMTSLESIVKEKGRERTQARFDARKEVGFVEPRLMSPQMAYSGF